ncbi:glutaredoxin family protein [Alkalicoccus urumqiensis]|uniref:NrdH-redoxin n=1 Tax=Alkalicoccus urumqiensis TaxID=1548213 RepID=A0A2P6MJL4_ALKUR|nr:glutaredoxin family protein [Alkalicoccus urumqiensis]PRO66478.1 NrdH-redoxin [Alkalicoccus urumqiensis]
MSVRLYTTNDCIECNFVKQALDARGVPYEVRNVREDAQYQEEVEALGYLGVPVMVYQGEAVKGMVPELEALIEKAAADQAE